MAELFDVAELYREGKFLRKIETFTDLRLYEPLVNKEMVRVFGGAAINDSKAGEFYYDAADTTTVDDDLDVIVTAGGKRWKRLTQRYATVAQGALADSALQSGDNISELTNDANYFVSDPLVEAIAALSTAADRMMYFNGVDTVAQANLTAYARTFLGSAAASDARTTLGLGTASVRDEDYFLKSSANFIVVSELSDFPTPVGGVITLVDNTTYYVVANVDLAGNRIVAGLNNTILGTSSETTSLSSTGLTGSPFITATSSLPIRHISLSGLEEVFDLDATASPGAAIDWSGVNFVNCASVGTIANYTNATFTGCASLSSGTLTFDGTFNTIAFSRTLLSPSGSVPAISLPATLTINRRFRVIYSALSVDTGNTGISVSDPATTFPNNESFILDNVSFTGTGTYLSGIDETDNEALFINNSGITNSGNIAEYYMTGNATATTIGTAGTFVKVAGTTTPYTLLQKFDLSTTNRATYIGALNGYFKVTAVLSVTSGSNNQEISARIALNGTTLAPSNTSGKTPSIGEYTNIMVQGVVELTDVGTDYVEIWITNDSTTASLTVKDMNVIIERLN